MTTPTVVVVSPTYNERATLERHTEAVLALGRRYRLLVVDDASPDGTGRLADELAAAHPDQVVALHRTRKEGLGPAYVAGLQAALAMAPDFVATMDADLSHDAADLARLVAAAETGADLVLGSRYVPGGCTPGWPRRRRLLSRLGGRYAGSVLGLPLADPTSGFRVLRRDTLAAIDLVSLRASGFAFNLELTWRCARAGCRIVEVPIAFHRRTAGASKLSGAIVAEAAVLVWKLRLGG